MISEFSPWPSFTDEEGETAKRIILSNRVNYWTGTECRAFEEEFARWCGSSRSVALANGTLALDAALTVLEIGSGDEVIVTPRTFLASVSSIVNSGARPVFADVDRDSQNITAKTIAPLITKKTKAIICVHLAGWPCEMDEICDLAAAHKVKVIEDCAQAHGASYMGKSVGSMGDVSAWSFCQDKIMTTGGEGGMLTTNAKNLWERAWSIKDHGKDWHAIYGSGQSIGNEFKWVHSSFGHNWRMTEVQGAIGRIQLRRMGIWHAARKANAERISEAALSCPALRVPEVSGKIEHAWYKYYVFIRKEALKSSWSRSKIVSELKTLGVPCFTGSCPEVYLEKAFDRGELRPEERLSIAKELGETSLMLLVHPTLKESEVQMTCDCLKRVATHALR